MKLMKAILALLLSLAVVLGSVTAFAQENEKAEQSMDTVYFYNIGGNGAGSGDLILVASEGHFGLIDAGHRKADTITDGDGTVYTCPQTRNLSSQVPFKNGEDALRYLVSSFGVTHLDFIIGTHSHSDHIGGVPEIAALTVTDKNGEEHSLVDENTVYFYKDYRHVNDVHDDLALLRTVDGDYEDHPVNTGSWHTQAYCYQAVNAMAEKGCALAELSHGVTVTAYNEPNVDFSDITASVNGVQGLEKARYFRGNADDYYDDFLIFEMGNLTIRLYNLFSHDTQLDENVNSIIAVVTDGNTKFVSLADINVENKTEQKLAKAIYDDIGTVDLLKVAHHGTVSGSNSREMLDWLQPKYAVVTRSRDYADGHNGRGSFSAAVMYAKSHFNTVLYEVGASDFGIAAAFSGSGLSFYNMEGEGESAYLGPAKDCISTFIPINGWSHWTVSWGDTESEELCYFYNGEWMANWYQDGDWYYYIDTASRYSSGWQLIGGSYYYFATDTYSGFPLNAMVTGWCFIDGRYYYFKDSGALAYGWTETPDGWYYFYDDSSFAAGGWYKFSGRWYYFGYDGMMRTGWLKSGGKWYYLGDSGVMLTGWQKIDGTWYRFDGNGVMLTGWQKVSKNWYCFGSSGAMVTGWLKSGGKWYYFDESGKMLTGWVKTGGNWYYFNASGAMQTGKVKIGGKEYTFAVSGVWVK